MVDLLLSKNGIQVNLATNTGGTPLHWAANNGHDEVVKSLLRKDGIQVNLQDMNGNTPLAYAAEGRHGRIVEMLLRKEAVRAVGWNGWRPTRRAPYPSHLPDIRYGLGSTGKIKKV